MRFQVGKVTQPQQGVKDAAVGEIDLWRLHLALPQVLVPRLKLSHDEGRREEVEVHPHRVVRDAERTAELGTVPDLSMIVGEHRPEPPQGRGADADPELGNVAFQKHRHELPSPRLALGIRSREERSREAAPHIPKGYNIVAGKLSFPIAKILDPKGLAPTLVATEYGKIAIALKQGVRKLTVREGLRLSGFPESYSLDNLSYRDAFDLIGNTVMPPVIKEVSMRLIK